MRTMDGVTLTPILGIGTFCTHTLVHSKQCIPYDPALPPEQMSLIGCGVMTGVGAALYSAGENRGRRWRSSAAAASETRSSWAVAWRGRRRSSASISTRANWSGREFGATHTVDPTEGDPVEAIKTITDGFGVNYSFEAVGRPDTTLQAIFSRDLAGTCVIIGVAGPRSTLDELPLESSSTSAVISVSPGMATAYRQGISRFWRSGINRAARSGPGRDPSYLTRRGGRGVPRHGAGRDAAIGDSDLAGSGLVTPARQGPALSASRLGPVRRKSTLE